MANIELYFYDQYGNRLTGLTQWDSNVILEIHGYPHAEPPIFHFTNKTADESLTTRSTISEGVVSVVVPNILLTRSRPIEVFVFQYDTPSNEGRTIYYERLPVRQKQKPNDYEYVDNTDVIELSSLGERLQTLIAEVEHAVSTRITDLDGKVTELDNAYAANVQAIRDAIQENVNSLNQTISDNRDALSQQITTSRNNFEGDIEAARQALIASIQDGSPKGYFATVEELADEPAGIYLCILDGSPNNGYIFYWNGTTLSPPLLYYSGVVVNNGSITLQKLSQELQNRIYEHIMTYTLDADEWVNGKQTISLDNEYVLINKTRIDLDIDDTTYQTLMNDGNISLFAVPNVNDNTLDIRSLGNAPSQSVTLQLTIRETL